LIFCCVFPACWKNQTGKPVIFDDLDVKDPGDYTVRVLLFKNVDQCVLSSSAGFSVRNSEMELLAHFGEDAKSVTTSIQDGKINCGGPAFDGSVIIVPDKDSLLSINSRPYRGNFKISISADGQKLAVINALGIEKYLAGVIGAEMPSYWESQALKAQTIAARTYCLFIKNRFGVNRSWDVRKSQANQVYGGVTAETATIRRAVNLTGGQVMECTLENGKKTIFPAYYSSTCGGHTESSYNTFGDFYPTLNGVKCPHCKEVSQKKYLSWGPVKFDQQQTTEKLFSRYPKLSELEKIKSIEPSSSVSPSRSGRVTSVRLIGENGKDSYLRGEDLRLTIDPTGKRIKSTLCKISMEDGQYCFKEGKGFGHGVGMCQYGTQAMARKGADFQEILQFYYPGMSLKKLY